MIYVFGWMYITVNKNWINCIKNSLLFQRLMFINSFYFLMFKIISIVINITRSVVKLILKYYNLLTGIDFCSILPTTLRAQQIVHTWTCHLVFIFIENNIVFAFYDTYKDIFVHMHITDNRENYVTYRNRFFQL